MAATVVGTSNGSATGGVVSTLSATPNYPAGSAAGDLILAFVFCGDFDSTRGGSVSAITADAGWSTYQGIRTNGTVYASQVFSRVIGAGESSATFTMTRSTSTLDQAGIHVMMVTLRGVDASAPVNAVISTGVSSTGANSIAASAVTTTVADCTVIVFAGGAKAGVTTFSFPAGTNTEGAYDVDHGDSNSGLAAGSRNQATAGSTGTTTVTLNSQLYPMAWTIAVAPQTNLSLNVSDASSAASESQSITATRPAADTGTGTEPASLPITVRPGSSDTGVGTESQSITASRPAADTGSGGESQTISATVTVSDTGTSSESALAINTAVGNDTGSFTDSVGRIDAKPVPGDASVGTESTTIAATAPAVSDTGSSTENATGGSSVPTADSSNPATESNRITVLQSDTVTATENASFVAGVFAGDAGVGSDVAVPGPVAITDTATAFESAYIFIEGVGVIGNRVERIRPEDRTIRSQRDPHVYQVKPENRLRIFGRDDRTVKVAPSKYDPVRVYSVEGEGV